MWTEWSDDRWASTARNYKATGRRVGGRPRSQWKDGFEAFTIAKLPNVGTQE